MSLLPSVQVDNGQVTTCLTNASSASTCARGYVCAPLTSYQLQALNGSLSGANLRLEATLLTPQKGCPFCAY